MMVKLLLYAYCLGKTSSRKIERATMRRYPSASLRPISIPTTTSSLKFRRRHLSALGDLFLQVLRLCQAAGLVKLGHVALDGTKVKANASRHKAMSYERMCRKEEELICEVAELLREAERVDQEEDRLYAEDARR